MSSYTDTHLCGGYVGKEWCEHFYRTGAAEEIVTKENGGMKRLDPMCYYCRESGYRKISSMAAWTGNSPRWCLKRIDMEAGE